MGEVRVDHDAGTVDFLVRNPDGQEYLWETGYTFQAPSLPPPVVTDLEPGSGEAGGQVADIAGEIDPGGGFLPGYALLGVEQGLEP